MEPYVQRWLYRCELWRDFRWFVRPLYLPDLAGEKNIGKVELRDKSGAIKLGTTKEVEGFIEMNNIRYQLTSDHQIEGSFMKTDNPSGFHVSQDGKRVAAIYTNGSISLQMLPNLTANQKDVLAVATIASAMSWRADADNE